MRDGAHAQRTRWTFERTKEHEKRGKKEKDPSEKGKGGITREKISEIKGRQRKKKERKNQRER